MKIMETVRKDGLRIISCHFPRKKRVRVELISRVGYAHDPEDKRGLFHTFEHMAFKGTKKRNLKELKKFENANFFFTNATTRVLSTDYMAGAIDRRLPALCDYLCDIYFNATYPKAELEKEKGAILLEIARKEDDDRFQVWRAMDEHLYKENPARLRGGGTVEGIKNITREDLLREKSIWHIPSNTIAIAIGSVKHADFVREINKHVPLDYKKVELSTWSDEAGDIPEEKNVVLEKPERKKVVLALSRKVPSKVDPKIREAASLLSDLLGDSQNSMLWLEIREKRGLAYTINCSFGETYGLARDFSVYAEVAPDKIDEVARLIWKVLKKSVLDKKTEFEELKRRAYEGFEINAIEQSDPFSYGNSIWRKIIDNKPVKQAESEDRERLKIISSLTINDLEKVRKELIKPEYFVRVVLKGK